MNTDSPADANLYTAIDAVAARHADKPCWIVPGRGEWRFADLRSQAARQAAALRVAGVRPGDRVLVQAEKSPEFVLLYLGCLRAGAVFVPLNTAYSRLRLAREQFVAAVRRLQAQSSPQQLKNLAKGGPR